MAGFPEGGDPKSRILLAAAELFAEHGFAGASVDEIARRAGVNKAMLYYYVGDKGELFSAVLSEAIEALRSLLQKVTEETVDPLERVRRMQAAILRAFGEHPALPGMVLREVVTGGAGLPDPVLAKLGQVIQVTVGVVEDGKARGAFRDVNPVLVHVMVIGLSGLFVNSMRMRGRMVAAGLLPVSPPIDPEEAARALSDIVLHGIAKTKKAGGKK